MSGLRLVSVLCTGLVGCSSGTAVPAGAVVVDYYSDCVASEDVESEAERLLAVSFEAWALAGEVSAAAVADYELYMWPEGVDQPDFDALPAVGEVNIAWPAVHDVSSLCRQPGTGDEDWLLRAEIDVPVVLDALGVAGTARLRRSFHNDGVESFKLGFALDGALPVWLPRAARNMQFTAVGHRGREGELVDGGLSATGTVMSAAGGEMGSVSLWSW